MERRKKIGIVIFLLLVGAVAFLLFSPSDSETVSSMDNDMAVEGSQNDEVQTEDERLADQARKDAAEQEKTKDDKNKQIIWYCMTEYAGCPTEEWITFLENGTYELKVQNQGMVPQYEEGTYEYLDEKHENIVLDRYGEKYQGAIYRNKLTIMDKTYEKTNLDRM